MLPTRTINTPIILYSRSRGFSLLMAPRQTITPQRTQVVAKRPRVRTPHKSVALDATPLQLQELEAAAAANPQAPPSRRLAAARKRFAKTAGAKDAVDISGRSAARDVEVNQINRARLMAAAAQVINHIDPNNPRLDPSRLPPRQGEPEAEDDLRETISELKRALEAWEVGIPEDHDDLSNVAASSGGPVLAAAAAAAVAQSSAAAAPNSAATYMGRPSPTPLPLPQSSALYPRLTPPQMFDLTAGDAEGSGGARRASAMEALAQVLLHRPRK